MDEPEITELEKIDADRVDGVGMPANGIGFLMMKQVAEPVEKDWAEWDAAHEGSGKGAAAARAKGGDSKASAADAVARARQTIADHKAGKKVTAAELKNAHEVHEAHLAHEAKLKADAKAKPPAKKELAKGARDCPKCDKSYDADHTGSKCENCGTDLPDAPAEKSFDHAAALELVKAVIGRGKVDEAPDIAGGTAVIAQIADLIIAEAQELKAGNTGEIVDIQQLACAAEMIWTWRLGEEMVASGSVQPATTLMQSAAKAEGWGPWTSADFAYFKKATDELVKTYARHEENFALGNTAKGSGPTAEERRQAASEGNALSDGSYPIRNEHELHAAAILARSGHGDVEGAKKLIARRAKELGVDNPLDADDDTSKSRIADEGTTVDTVTQTGELTELVKAAVTEATAPLKERLSALDAELAKVKATPVPTGMVLSRNVQVKRPGSAADDDLLAKAARYREKAALQTSPADREGYLALARETEQEARTKSA